jgi:hypothetical protein
MKVYLKESPSVYLENTFSKAQAHGSNMVAGGGGAPSTQFASNSPQGGPQYGGPKILLSVGKAVEQVMSGEDMYKERADEHYKKAAKCMSVVSKMLKGDEGNPMNADTYKLMKQLHAMHKDLGDRFADGVIGEPTQDDRDGLMAASAYAHKAHDILEGQMKEQEEKSLTVPGYADSEKRADPPLYLQPHNEGRPNVMVPSNTQTYGG